MSKFLLALIPVLGGLLFIYYKHYLDSKQQPQNITVVREKKDSIFEKGVEHYLRSEFDNAEICFQKALKNGNTESYFFLGRMKQFGEGCSINLKEAKKFYKRAISNGDSKGYYGYGTLEMYSKKPDIAIQNAQFSKAKSAIILASDNNIFWKVSLAAMYKFGLGVKKDEEKAHYMLKELEACSYGRAQYLLGDNYFFGKGTDRNIPMAITNFIVASESGFGTTGDYENLIGETLLYGNGIDTNVNAAMQWLKVASEKGHSRAQVGLTYCYLSEDLGYVDIKKAYFYAKLASEHGEPGGQAYLAYILLTYYNDQSSFVALAEKAANSGLAYAQYLLGAYYVNLDDQLARKWLTMASYQNHPRAIALLENVHDEEPRLEIEEPLYNAQQIPDSEISLQLL